MVAACSVSAGVQADTLGEGAARYLCLLKKLYGHTVFWCSSPPTFSQPRPQRRVRRLTRRTRLRCGLPRRMRPAC